MFASTNLEFVNFSDLNLSNTTSMVGTSQNMSVTPLRLSGLDVSSVTDMSDLFNCAQITDLYLRGWNTSSNPTSTGWLLGGGVTTIYCNAPDTGGSGSNGAGTFNGVSCN